MVHKNNPVAYGARDSSYRDVFDLCVEALSDSNAEAEARRAEANARHEAEQRAEAEARRQAEQRVAAMEAELAYLRAL